MTLDLRIFLLMNFGDLKQVCADMITEICRRVSCNRIYADGIW
jgi:hypothetical protein